MRLKLKHITRKNVHYYIRELEWNKNIFPSSTLSFRWKYIHIIHIYSTPHPKSEKVLLFGLVNFCTLTHIIHKTFRTLNSLLTSCNLCLFMFKHSALSIEYDALPNVHAGIFSLLKIIHFWSHSARSPPHCQAEHNEIYSNTILTEYLLTKDVIFEIVCLLLQSNHRRY